VEEALARGPEWKVGAVDRGDLGTWAESKSFDLRSEALPVTEAACDVKGFSRKVGAENGFEGPLGASGNCCEIVLEGVVREGRDGAVNGGRPFSPKASWIEGNRGEVLSSSLVDLLVVDSGGEMYP
jgi:hypothetical protein